MSRFLYSFVLFAALVIVGLPFGTQAANEKQEECYNYLHSSILSIPAFSSLHDEVEDLKYADVVKELSDYYKNISSFGVDLRSPDFDMKMYSFGRETGYQHPPFSPFPTYTMSDKWDTPANEYIYAEEYIRNPQTNERHFISCSLMSIEDINLKGVTAEKYLYDGALSSVLFTSQDQNYKVWYSNNDSYDHEGRNFASWRRLFVYPKSTINNYFDKYTVVDSFPARVTESLSDIKKLSSKDNTEENRDLLSSPELAGNDTVFALNSYYQAIENSFPDFGTKLALRGVLQFSTVKELLSTREVPEFTAIWQSVLDPRELTKYALLKENNKLKPDNGDGVTEVGEESSFYEDQLQKIKSMTLEQEAKYLLENVSERNPVVEEEDAVITEVPEVANDDTNQNERVFIIVTVVGLVLVLASLLIAIRKRKLVETNVVEQ